MAFNYYANIKDQDLDAIIAYLRSLTAKQCPELPIMETASARFW